MMTNKEMIIELQYAIDLIKQNGQDWLDERDIPILEGAISALQAQEAKHSNESSLTQKALDTISRQAVISYIDRIMHQGTGKNKSFEYIKKYVEKLQSAQPDVPDTNVGDMISRQALCEYALNQKDKSVTPNDIMRFPSAQPERRKEKWILCSERLPEEHIGFYLVTVQKRRITALNVVGCDNTVHDIDIARWDYDRRAPQRGYHWCKADKVVAWMPLPEPYKGE